MQVVGVNAQECRGVGNASGGPVQRAENELFFQVANRVVIFSGRAASGFGSFQNALREIFRQNPV